MHRILNLGAGVQSSTILLMCCKGLLPKVDMAIFADTGWEPGAVYSHLDWLGEEASSAGIPIHRVSGGDLREATINARIGIEGRPRNRFATMPLRVLNPDGSKGLLRRQCTSEYKIQPIEKFIKTQVLGLRLLQNWPREVVVEQWFGISTDEASRAKPPRKKDGTPAKWRRHVYPLLDMALEPDGKVKDVALAGLMSRHACLCWLERNYPGRVVPKSACIGCPFHSNVQWREIKAVEREWKDAIEVDRSIRHSWGRNGTAFLHQDAKPLEDIDLRTDFDKGQFNLFENECEGMCGL